MFHATWTRPLTRCTYVECVRGVHSIPFQERSSLQRLQPQEKTWIKLKKKDWPKHIAKIMAADAIFRTNILIMESHVLHEFVKYIRIYGNYIMRIVHIIIRTTTCVRINSSYWIRQTLQTIVLSKEKYVSHTEKARIFNSKMVWNQC